MTKGWVQPTYARACKALPAVYGAQAGTQPACVVVSFTGKQLASDCLAEGATAAYSVCYSEIEVVEAGEVRRYFLADHPCTTPTTSALTTPNDAVCGMCWAGRHACGRGCMDPVCAQSSPHQCPPRCRMPCAGKQVRLSAGTEGLLEVNIGGTWGSICDEYFTDREADAVCRQLGLPTPGRAVGAATWGPSAGPVHPVAVYCKAFQNRLGECNMPNVGAKCTHAQVSARPAANGRGGRARRHVGRRRGNHASAAAGTCCPRMHRMLA